MNYQEISKNARLTVLRLIHDAGTSHIGSNFSCADIMTVLFEYMDLEKDKFILSAGWKAAMLYYHLWRKGKITEEQLNSYCQEGSDFIGLAEPIIPEIPFAGGSMGYGFPAAVGFALAKKLRGEPGKVYCLMSDGELAIGTTWESALIARQHNLDNLVVIVDENSFQAMGQVKDILDTTNTDVWDSLGWWLWHVDGHNFEQIERALGPTNEKKKPTIIFANTIKGKGVPFMENDNLWHYAQIQEEDYKKAVECLTL